MHDIFQNNWTNPWNTVNFPETTLTKTDLDLTIPQDAYAIPEAPQKYAGIDFDAIDYLTTHDFKHQVSPTLLQENGHLTKEALARIEKLYIEYYESDQYAGLSDGITQQLSVDNLFGPAEPHYTVSIFIPYDTEGTVEEIFDTYINPFYNLVQDITNLDTTKAPYLFWEIQ